MGQVKAQYSVLLENIKQMSFQDLQGELDHSRGSPVRAHHTQQAFAVHRADMEAQVVQVRRGPSGASIGQGEAEDCFPP